MSSPSSTVTDSAPRELSRISTGSAGLDDILGGGFDANRMYLYEGQPGTGKTTIALQFLLKGVRGGERVLYISLSETKRELDVVAQRHGWTLDGIDIFELVPPETTLDPERELTVFHPAEMELSETTGLIFREVERINPTRVVLDSLSELRLLAQNPLRYRRQVLALKHFFTNRNCTVVLLDDLSSSQDDLQLHSIAHGVVMLEQVAIDYGAERRRLRVIKMRGIRFRGGFHDFTIERGGLQIFPRLVAAEHHKAFLGEFTPSGNAELDQLLGGGLERGTNALLIGAAGVGKSSVALTYAIAAAERGEHAVFFAFDEGRGTVEARARTLGLHLQEHVDTGLVRFQQIDPAELSPGEFAANVRKSVEADNARLVIIDSLNGYLAAMPDERFLILQMHELPRAAGCADHPGPRPAWPRRSDGYATRHQLSQRFRAHAALFRGRRNGAARSVCRQEAQRPTRAYHPGISARQHRHHARPAPKGVQRHLFRQSALYRGIDARRGG